MPPTLLRPSLSCSTTPRLQAFRFRRTSIGTHRRQFALSRRSRSRTAGSSRTGALRRRLKVAHPCGGLKLGGSTPVDGATVVGETGSSSRRSTGRALAAVRAARATRAAENSSRACVVVVVLCACALLIVSAPQLQMQQETYESSSVGLRCTRGNRFRMCERSRIKLRRHAGRREIRTSMHRLSSTVCLLPHMTADWSLHVCISMATGRRSFVSETMSIRLHGC